jgi:hypothetical protein
MPTFVSNRDLRLGAGLLLLAVGIALAQSRMAGDWSRGVLLLIALGAFAVSLALLFARPAAGNSPPPLTSLLSGLAFAYGALSVYRFAAIAAPHHTVTHAGTLTWLLLAVTAIGALLAHARRCAVVALLTLIALATTVLVASDWVFTLHRTFSTYHYFMLGLAVIYLAAAMWVSSWQRLSSVLYVAVGFLLLAIAETQFGFQGLLVLPVVAFLGNLAHPAWGWEVVMLLGGLSLAAAATVRRDPGPGYVAALVLFVWVLLAESPGKHEVSIIGWPLLALLVGLVAITIAVTDTEANRFSLTRSPDLLAAGALALALSVLLVQERMAATWSTGVLLAIALVGMGVTAAFALAQPRTGNEPTGPTSLLAALTLAYAVLVVDRFARLGIGSPVSHAGTATWMFGAAAVVGVGLAYSRRSAGVALFTLALGAASVLAGAQWLFHVARHVHGYSYVFIVLALIYAAIAWASRDAWPRLATVCSVAGGLAAAVGAATLLYFQIVIPIPAVAAEHLSIDAGWLIVTLVAALAMAGAAALRREAGPAYASALLLVLVVLLDRRRDAGQSASVVLWPLLLSVLGAAVALSSLVRPRSEASGSQMPTDGGGGGPADDSAASAAIDG